MDYYVEAKDKTTVLRRYPTGAEIGERWDGNAWTEHACQRTACHLTKDRQLTPAEAQAQFPEAFNN